MTEHPGENPFIGFESWQIMLDSVQRQVEEFMEKGYDK